MGHELIHQELSEAIIGAAMTVLNVIKPGLDEKLYDRSETGVAPEFQECQAGMEADREVISVFLSV